MLHDLPAYSEATSPNICIHVPDINILFLDDVSSVVYV